MVQRLICFLLVFVIISCSPTSWLKLDILNPAEFTFPDSGKVSILNACYLPSVISSKSNLITQIPLKEQFIFDTIIITNLFNGLFSVLNESPVEDLRNAEYEEIRTVDTTNFLGPLANKGVEYICRTLDSRFLISCEYYSFNRNESRVSSIDYGWQLNLEVGHTLIWRIYQNDGIMLNQFIDSDTLYWVENIDTYSLPELPDAVREVFFLAGEKFGRRISPYWSTIQRKYFLISRNGDDISLDRDQLLIFTVAKRKSLAFKACYNLAVICESEDNLQEALKWLDKAVTIMPWESIDFYREKLEKRLVNRQKIDFQSRIINN